MSDIARAQERARRLYSRSKSFQSAYVKGARAAIIGHDTNACPYPRDAATTWRRAYRKAWLRGHESVPQRVE